MPALPARITIRKTMAAVAVVALALAAMKVAEPLRYSTYTYGRNTSVFAVGDRVAPIVDIRVGGSPILAGTPCRVVSDPPDEDSAYPDRAVKVRLEDRDRPGLIFEVKRVHLRARWAPGQARLGDRTTRRTRPAAALAGHAKIVSGGACPAAPRRTTAGQAPPSNRAECEIMELPPSYLTGPTTVERAVAEHTHEGRAFGDVEDDWRRLLAKRLDGDELWNFAPPGDHDIQLRGVALVRGGGVIATVITSVD